LAELGQGVLVDIDLLEPGWSKLGQQKIALVREHDGTSPLQQFGSEDSMTAAQVQNLSALMQYDTIPFHPQNGILRL
jgi:hypothetical protein